MGHYARVNSCGDGSLAGAIGCMASIPKIPLRQPTFTVARFCASSPPAQEMFAILKKSADVGALLPHG